MNPRNQFGVRAVSDLVDQAMDFELPDERGNVWSLADHLARGPLVLVFYRGDW